MSVFGDFWAFSCLRYNFFDVVLVNLNMQGQIGCWAQMFKTMLRLDVVEKVENTKLPRLEKNNQ